MPLLMALELVSWLMARLQEHMRSTANPGLLCSGKERKWRMSIERADNAWSTFKQGARDSNCCTSSRKEHQYRPENCTAKAVGIGAIDTAVGPPAKKYIGVKKISSFLIIEKSKKSPIICTRGNKHS